MRAKGIVLVVIILMVSGLAGAEGYRIQYDAEANRVLQLGGNTLRGNFATRAEAEAYQRSRPKFEQDHSWIVAPQAASPRPPEPPARPSGEAERQRAAEEERQRAVEAERERARFATAHSELMRSLRVGTPTAVPGLKTGTTALPLKVSGNPPSGRNQQRASESLEAKVEHALFENKNADWVKAQTRLIDDRLREPNPYANAIYKSLKTKVPPPLPLRKYVMLQPGDVLLISPEDKPFWDRLADASFWINAGDRVSSLSRSPASHTVLYLKEVNGTKLFLDHTSERGSHVITEAEFLKTYGQRDAVVAQPVKEADTAKIWEATKELVEKEQLRQAKRKESVVPDAFRDLSGFGLYGADNMVCSEASRWVLVNSGLKIPESASPLKRHLGIHYGPANFFSDRRNFIITPLYGVPK
ncbi:MAG TPA: hypothetical protein VNE39_12800 [Planctomycetota bacterium]|nr:hypothetical protein [Planctomycetota bacterium]